MLLLTSTCAPKDAVNECFDWLVDSWKARLCQTRGCFWLEPVILSGGDWVWADVRNPISFVRITPFIAEFHPSSVFEIKLHFAIDSSQPVVFSDCEAKIARWFNPKLGAYSFVWGYVIMVVEWIKSGVSRQSAYALDATKLVQNPPYREIHVKLVECPYLWCKWPPFVKDFTRNSASLRRTKHRKVKLLRPIFCLALLTRFSLQPMICVWALFAEICREILLQKIRLALHRFYSLDLRFWQC